MKDIAISSKKKDDFEEERKFSSWEEVTKVWIYYSTFDFYYTFQDLFLEIFASTFQLIKSKKPIKESIYDHKTLHPLSKEMMKDIRSKGERYFFEEKMMERNESSNILFNFRFLSFQDLFLEIFASTFQMINFKKLIKIFMITKLRVHPLSTILCNLGGQWKISIRSKGEYYFFEEKMVERNESSPCHVSYNFRFLFQNFFLEIFPSTISINQL